MYSKIPYPEVMALEDMINDFQVGLNKAILSGRLRDFQIKSKQKSIDDLIRIKEHMRSFLDYQMWQVLDLNVQQMMVEDSQMKSVIIELSGKDGLVNPGYIKREVSWL